MFGPAPVHTKRCIRNREGVLYRRNRHFSNRNINKNSNIQHVCRRQQILTSTYTCSWHATPVRYRDGGVRALPCATTTDALSCTHTRRALCAKVRNKKPDLPESWNALPPFAWRFGQGRQQMTVRRAPSDSLSTAHRRDNRTPAVRIFIIADSGALSRAGFASSLSLYSLPCCSRVLR